MASSQSWFNADPDSDVESVASSIPFVDGESSSAFRLRVVEFALQQIWPYATAEEITLEPIEGKENRIICISRQPLGKPELRERYVLHTPEYDIEQLNGQLATLRFLRLNGKIPAPVVLAFDKTDDNVLGTRYMLQDFIPGATLLSSYSGLTHEERCKVARELGRVYRELLGTRSSMPGFLTLSKGNAPSSLRMISLGKSSGRSGNGEYDDSSTSPDVHQFLVNTFMGQWAFLDVPLASHNVWPILRDQFCQMASEMAAEGWFHDCHTSLAHLELAPHGILINPTSDTRRPIISAILDWDESVFVPQLMCCQPPMWLWAWNDGDEQDERLANEIPPTPEGRQIKQDFEEAAGPDYLRFAYAPAYRLARQLVRFAVNDVRSDEDYEEAREMLEEWKTIHTNSKLDALVEEENVWNYVEPVEEE